MKPHHTRSRPALAYACWSLLLSSEMCRIQRSQYSLCCDECSVIRVGIEWKSLRSKCDSPPTKPRGLINGKNCMTLCDWNEDGGCCLWSFWRRKWVELWSATESVHGESKRRVFTVNREGCDLSVSYYNFTWFLKTHTHLWPSFDLDHFRAQRVPVWYQSLNISRSNQMVFNMD